MKINFRRCVSYFCTFIMIIGLSFHSAIVLADGPAVDTYGQFVDSDFPEKIKSDEQLKATAEWEKQYFDSLTAPNNLDEYGGLSGSKEELGLKETGFFHTEKLSNGKWVMVNPLGNLYFSLGLTGIGYIGDTYTVIEGRREVYEWLPPYSGEYFTAFMEGRQDVFSFYLANQIKKYGKPFAKSEYVKRSIDRAKKWGFNSGGGWTDHLSYQENDFPLFIFLYPPKNMVKGARVYDVFRPNWEQELENAFKGSLEKNKDNKLIMGYYIDNELEFAKMTSAIPAAKASETASKKKLVDVLKEKYNGDIAAFNTAWERNNTSFDEIYEDTSLAVKNDQSSADLNEFFELYFDTYYGTIAKVFRKYAPNQMLAGDRLANNTPDMNKMAVKYGGKYMDIISYNYYAYDIKSDMLKELAEISGKPLMLTEFHYGEPTHGYLATGQMLKDNEAQGLGYRNYVEKTAASGYVVGTHWFQYTDVSATGRWYEGLNGTAAAIGVVDVTDQPYLPLVTEMKKTNDSIYDVILGKREPYAYTDFPPEKGMTGTLQIPKSKGPIAIDGVVDANWPEFNDIIIEDMHRVLGVYEFGLGGEFKFAWDEDNLYMYAHILDPTPMTNTRGSIYLWNGDAVELFFGTEEDKLDLGGSLKPKDCHVMVGANAAGENTKYYWFNNRTKDEQDKVDMFVVMDSDKKGYTIEAAFPMKGLYINSPDAGREFRFDFALDNGTEQGSRTHQFAWNGTKSNSIDRTDWGRAVLVNEVEEVKVTETPEVTASEAFMDLDGVEWAKESINELSKLNIVAGVGNNKFDPNSNVTRAAFTKMVIEAFAFTDDTAKADFKDVSGDSWAYKYIASAQKKGIVVGNADGTFGVDTAITREQMAAIAYRAADAAGVKLTQAVAAMDFTDAQKIAPYAKDAVSVLQQGGVISGLGGNFDPGGNATRAQAARIVYLLLKAR